MPMYTVTVAIVGLGVGLGKHSDIHFEMFLEDILRFSRQISDS